MELVSNIFLDEMGQNVPVQSIIYIAILHDMDPLEIPNTGPTQWAVSYVRTISEDQSRRVYDLKDNHLSRILFI